MGTKQNRQKYEVTNVEHGVTETLTRKECEERFGREEFIEYLQGCFPHVVVVEL